MIRGQCRNRHGTGPLFLRWPQRFPPLREMLAGRRRYLPSWSWWYAACHPEPDVEYFGPDWNAGYADGLNDRPPIDARMSDHNYRDGYDTGWAEQGCPRKYRHMAKDDGT